MEPLHTTDEKKSIRRRELLDAALAEFSDKGYHGAQISDIIARADVARGTFYLYFKSKREIFGCLLDEIFIQVKGCVEGLPKDGIDQIPQKMRENMERLMTLFISKPEIARVLLCESVSLDPESDERLKHFYGLLLGYIQIALHQGQEMGFVRPANNPILAVQILGVLKEMLYQKILNLIDFSVEEAVSEMFSTILAMVKK